MISLHFRVLFFLGILLVFRADAQDLLLTGKGYDMHTELNWNALPIADRYQIWRKAENEAQFSLLASTRKLRRIDWTGRPDEADHVYRYYIEALSVPGAILSTSDTVETIITPFTDDDMLDMVQEYTFRYFYEYAHPVSGMARERLGSDDVVTTGGTGFGIMALLVGIQRGFITRTEGVNQLLKIVSFLQFADRYHGAYPHWMNGKTGDVIPFSTWDDGGDLVETAFLMQGLLCARQYFNADTEEENALRDIITSLWEDVEWDHYSRNNSGVLYWHWSPNFEWQMNFPIRGYNEAMIVYLLAIASPTHAVNASYWHTGWAGPGYVNGNSWYGIKLFVGPHFGGPLFFAHYSYLGFDPRNIKDAYANYFDQNHNHTLINRSWCIDNPLNFEGYSENSWGLTASDDPFGYFAHAPGGGTDNGTLTPAAAIPSMPYTPSESIEVLKHLYRTYGENLWGEFGFYDAFNPEENWFADSYLAIDQGPIIDMIENYRSGLLWTHFMSNSEIAPALSSIGFVEDPTSTAYPSTGLEWNIFPTIAHGEIFVEIPTTYGLPNFTVHVTDLLGRIIPIEIHQMDDHLYKVSILFNSDYSGWTYLFISDEKGIRNTKPIWIR